MSAGVIFAAGNPGNVQNRMSGLVAAIAQKFHLNVQDVQQVFDAQRQQSMQQMQAQQGQRMKARLDQAVKDGKLTQSQEDQIIAKQQEVQTFMASLQGKNPQDRQSAIKTEMDSLKSWAQSNNIPSQYLMPFGGRMGGMHGMHGWGRGMMGGGWKGGFGMPHPTTSTSTTSS